MAITIATPDRSAAGSIPPTPPNVLVMAESAPDEGVIELLRDLLAAAERGDLVAVAGITRMRGSEFGEFYSDSMMDSFLIPSLAYLRVLQMRMESKVEME